METKMIKKIVRRNKFGFCIQSFLFDKNGFEFGDIIPDITVKDLAFDDNGNISRVDYFFVGGDGCNYKQTEDFVFDEQGRLIGKNVINMCSIGSTRPWIKNFESKLVNEYDNEGNCIYHDYHSDDDCNPEIEYYRKVFDEKGRCVEIVKQASKTEYIYSDDKLIKENYYTLDSDGKSTFYVLSHTTLYKYDSIGRIILKTNEKEGFEHSFNYEDETLVSEKSIYFHDISCNSDAETWRDILCEFTEGLFKIYEEPLKEHFFDNPFEAITIRVEEEVSYNKEKTTTDYIISMISFKRKDGSIIEESESGWNTKSTIELNNPGCIPFFEEVCKIKKEVIKTENDIQTIIYDLDSNTVLNELTETYDDRNRLIKLKYVRDGKVVLTQSAEYIGDTTYESKFEKKTSYPTESEDYFTQEIEYW